jgi:hypothetical protein
MHHLDVGKLITSLNHIEMGDLVNYNELIEFQKQLVEVQDFKKITEHLT